MKVLLVGGGTGGHIYPLLALIRAWEKVEKSRNIEAHFVIARNNADKYILDTTRYSYTEIPVAKLRRYFSIQNFLDFFTFIGNLVRAIFIMYTEKPDIIFSKGGFVSLPIGFISFLFNIPFYLHETDSQMGLSNKILSRFSEKIFTGFPSKNPLHIFVGNPVRNEFFLKKDISLEGKNREEKNAFIRPLIKIFIFGGSQGALTINKWARNFFSDYFNTIYKVDVLLVTGKGKKHNPLFDEDNHGVRPNFSEVEFLHDDFVQKIHEADIVITRAGGAIAELAAAKKAVVLIPLPSAANNHQFHNAQFFVQNDAALIIEEKNLYSEDTLKLLESLIISPEKRKELAENLSKFANKNVAENIWNIIAH